MVRELGAREVAAERILNRLHQPLNLVGGQWREIVVVFDVVHAATIS